MNAIEYLKTDHDRLLDFFDRIEVIDDRSEIKRLFQEIKKEVELHIHLEEAVFYPVFHRRSAFAGMIEDARAGHEEMRAILDEMSVLSEETAWDECLDDLIDCVESHIEAEETDLFPKVEETLDEEQLNHLGAKLEDARRAFLSSAAA